MSAFNIAAISQQLHTIADYLRFATSQFNQADLFFGHGTDNAQDEATILVAFALHYPANRLSQVADCRLIDDEKIALLEIIARRINEQIPAAYITRLAYFAGLPFYIDERVLVPRSPIAELITKHFYPMFSAEHPPQRILDLCTGSGCIAIACATVFPDAEVDAIDLSVDALNVAQINIENHGLTAQVIPIQSDVFSGISGLTYDLIVTNPPYVDEQDIDTLPAEYTHEPAMGLGCGADGLNIVRKILAQANDFLNDNGVLICEVGNSQQHVVAVYPQVPFNWLTFEHGGHGVFMLTKTQLVQYSELFKEQAKNS